MFGFLIWLWNGKIVKVGLIIFLNLVNVWLVIVELRIIFFVLFNLCSIILNVVFVMWYMVICIFLVVFVNCVDNFVGRMRLVYLIFLG